MLYPQLCDKKNKNKTKQNLLRYLFNLILVTQVVIFCGLANASDLHASDVMRNQELVAGKSQQQTDKALTINLSEQEKAWLSEHPVIRVGGSSEFEPKLILNPDGTYSGIYPELFGLLEEPLGVRFEIVDDKWPEILRRAEAKEVDVVALMGNVVAAKMGLMTIEAPYNVLITAFARKDHRLEIARDKDIEGLRVAYNKEIVFLKKHFDSMKGRIEVVEADSPLNALKLLLDKKADVMVGFNQDSYLLSKHTIREIEPVYTFKSLVSDSGTAIRSDAPLLASILGKAFNSISHEERNRILSKWSWMPENKESAVALIAEEKVWLAEHPRLRMGFDATYPPFDFLGDDGKHTGISADYLKIISERLDISIEPVYGLSWTEVLEKAKRKEIDVISPLTKREQRSKYLLFGKPFIKNNMTLVTRDDSPFITSLEDFSGKRVALVRGYGSTRPILEHYSKLVPHFVETYFEALKAVSTGQVEGAVIHVPVAAYLIRKHYFGNLKFAAPIDIEQPPMGIGVRKDWPELVGILNKALDSISEEERQAIRKKWIGLKYEEKIDYALIWKTVAGFTVLLLLVLLWIWKTRRQNEVLRKTQQALQKSEQYNRMLFEESTIGLALCRMNGELVDINPAFVSILGRSVEETLKLTYWDITPEKYAAKEQSQLASLEKTGRYGPYEKEYIHTDGHLVPVRLSGQILEKGGEKFIWSSVEDITEYKQAEEALRKAHDELDMRVQERTAELAQANDVLSNEIKERRQMEEALRTSEQMFRSIFDYAPLGVAVVDEKGYPVIQNTALQNMLGYTKEEFSAMSFVEFTHPDDITKDLERYQALYNNHIPSYSIDKRYIHKDGSIVWGALTVSAIRDSNDNFTYAVGMVDDITERKQTEEKTQELLEQNRSLTQRLFGLQEAERRHLAQELHDELGQWLTAIQADAQLISNVTAQSDSQLHSSAQAVLSNTNEVQKCVRDMIHQLRPSLLDELGLKESLREHVSQWQSQHTGTKCNISCNGDLDELGETLNITLYRIVQESLTNVAKHAQAMSVSIKLESVKSSNSPAALILTIQDDGKGMDVDKNYLGMGLPGMRERVLAAAGEFNIQSSPGKGMRIEVCLPVTQQENV